MSSLVDLRSDTVTSPTAAMRQAMADAEVADDVFGEDPTVRRLETTCAQLCATEAAVLMPSGTMSNLACLLAHSHTAGRGSEVILGDLAHIAVFERNGASGFAGLRMRTVPTDLDGALPLDDLAEAIAQSKGAARFASLENTHNLRAGAVLPITYIRDAVGLLAEDGLSLHLDGARLWNAAAALDVPLHELATGAATVSMSFTKGLGAPVGSVVCASRPMVDQVRFYRQMLGGVMHQAGVWAAAALVAIDGMADRLREDHVCAAQLADGLRQLLKEHGECGVPQTNIVMVNLSRPIAPGLVRRLWRSGIGAVATTSTQIRLVTHTGISPTDIERAVDVFGDHIADEYDLEHDSQPVPFLPSSVGD